MANKNEELNILTSRKVKEIINKENKGITLKNSEKLWFKNIKDVRKPYLKFGMTKKEREEYYKCKMSVHYFAQEYCQIKLEDGTIGHMKLRDYQKDIIDLYTQNRFSILLASRQIGKCVSFDTTVDIIDDKTEEVKKTYFFELYYKIIKTTRKLTFLENFKYFLYRLYVKI